MNVAIAGYGIEGKANYTYFSKRGHNVTILDERDQVDDLPMNASVVLGKNALTELSRFDMIVRTPSLSPHKLQGAKKIWSGTNEFFKECPALIIGVTGSKGKGTTVSLIASILRAVGKTVHIVGNIGAPALEVLNQIQSSDVVVYELSSFQLWDIETSPHIAVLLMIEPDHLDVHTDFKEYLIAKSNIAHFQTKNDLLIYNAANEYSRAVGEDSVANTIPFPSRQGAHVQDGFFWYGAQKICSVDTLKLPGVHNQDNACAAIDVAWEFTQYSDGIEKGLSSFFGLSHRLKLVREVNGVRYYDDSIATTPGSAIAAINAFNEPKILILGGSSKGSEYDELAKVIASHNVKKTLVIGSEAPKIEAALHEQAVSFVSLGSEVTMQKVVAKANEIADAGDAVILSPACASFGMFKNYNDRGDQFIAAVEAL